MIGPATRVVGRDPELGELVEALRSGRSALFVVVGEAGIGKTTLADAFGERAAAEGAKVAWGRAWEAGDAPAYHPWAQIARDLGLELPTTPDDAIDPSRARFVFFEHVLGQLETACARDRLVLVLDDLHAADTASLLLLSFVVRHLRRLRMVVVCTWRHVEARQDLQTERILADIAREGTWLRLGRLGEADVRALAEGMAAKPFGADALAEVYRVTEGHPLFVREALRLLASRSGSGRPLVMPDDTRGTIRSRLSGLDADTRALLGAASVVGREVGLDLLASLAAATDVEVERAAARAAAAGIVDEGDGRTLRFSHVLMRDEAYRAVAAEQRPILHARAADALALRSRGSAAELGEIAHHRTLAVAAGGIEQAVDATLGAARAELAELAFEDAAARIDRAIARFAERMAPAMLAELHLLAALARMRAQRIEDGKRDALAAAAIAKELHDASLLARSALAYGSEFTPGYVDPKLIELLEEAIANNPAANDGDRAKLLARLAAAKQPAPDPDVPIAMAEEAIAIARRSGDRATLRAVLHSALSTMATLGHAPTRRSLGEEMLGLSASANDRVQVWRCHVRLMVDCYELGDIAGAEQHLLEHERIAAEFRQDYYRGAALLQRTLLALHRADWDAHERCLAQLRALEGYEGGLVEGAVKLHHLERCITMRDWAAAEGALAAIVEFLWKKLPSIGAAPFVAFLTARLRCRTGDLEAARAALDQLPAPRLELYRRFFTLSGAVVAAVGSDVEREAMLEVFASRSHSVTSVDMVGSNSFDQPWRIMGLLHRALGRLDEAIACHERAVALLERTGGVAWLPLVREELATMRELAGMDPARDRGRAAKLDTPMPTMTRRGDAYEIVWGEERAFLQTSRGLELLAALVASPDVEILALVLESGSAADRGSAGPAIDEQAMRSYRARAEQLRAIEEDATSLGHVERADRAREELEQLTDELARSVGLRGRPREEGSAPERARINVQRHLKKAIARISAEMPGLGRHLQWAVRTGTYCMFRTK